MVVIQLENDCRPAGSSSDLLRQLLVRERGRQQREPRYMEPDAAL
ncbi:hypothetical protein [Oscillatoria sp. FACHB-1407]